MVTNLEFIHRDASRIGCCVFQAYTVEDLSQSLLFNHLFLEEPKLSLHLIAPLNFIDEVTMESIDIGVKLQCK